MSQHFNAPVPDSTSPLRVYNRVESRPRSADFQRSLRAEIHDPLWMLCRQRQFGELKGEDTGSAVTAEIKVVARGLSHDAAQRAFDAAVPVEAQMEALPVVWDLRLRLRVAQYWRRLLEGGPLAAGAAAYVAAFRQVFPLAAQPPADLPVGPELLAAWAFAAGREMDGEAFVAALSSRRGEAARLLPGPVSAPHAAALNDAGAEFLRWLAGLQVLPMGNTWSDEGLSYNAAFGARQPGSAATVLAADAYNGDYDWYSFDAEQSASHPARTTAQPARQERVETVLFTSRLRFPGMPAARWWEIEDSRVNFGRLDADPSHLAQILLAEFALTYSNDWFLVPLTLPANAVCVVESLVVTDVFGCRTVVRPAGAAEQGWDRFALFATERVEAGRVAHRSNEGLFLAAPVPSLQGDPVEEILWARDEMANLVWAVEKTVPDGLGGGADGAALGRLRRALLEASAPAEAAEETPYAFRLRAEAQPEHWIPFVPVAAQSGARPRLQRARIKRMIGGDHVGDITPMSTTLGAGETPWRPRFVADGEVGPSGLRIVRTWQRARGPDGRVVLWSCYRRAPGHGELTAPVRADTLVERQPEATTANGASSS